MIGANKIVLNQAEACRLMSIALSADTLKDEKVKVTKIDTGRSTSSGVDEFEVTVEGETAGPPPF